MVLHDGSLDGNAGPVQPRANRSRSPVRVHRVPIAQCARPSASHPRRSGRLLARHSPVGLPAQQRRRGLVGSSAGDAALPSVRTQYNDACPFPGPPDHAMKDLVPSASGLEPAVKQAHKLQAALDYLGDWLVTHAASRFKPSSRPLLDRWREHRRGRREGTSLYLVGGYRSWLTETELPRLPEVAESRRPTMRKPETLRYARLDQRKRRFP